MTEGPPVPDATDSNGRCPWCSAPIADTDAVTCPSCGANLATGEEQPIPGVTAVDVDHLLRTRAVTAQRRGGLIGWLSGEEPDTIAVTHAERAGLEPPSRDVRIEMLRMEIEATRLALESELAADAATADQADLPGPFNAAPAGSAEPEPPGSPATTDAEGASTIAVSDDGPDDRTASPA